MPAEGSIRLAPVPAEDALRGSHKGPHRSPALLLAAGGLRADDGDKAEKAVKEFLVETKVDVPITPVADEAVKKAFPDASFFAPVFRQYPVARAAPEPFKS